jgi:hypothetical protein
VVEPAPEPAPEPTPEPTPEPPAVEEPVAVEVAKPRQKQQRPTKRVAPVVKPVVKPVSKPVAPVVAAAPPTVTPGSAGSGEGSAKPVAATPPPVVETPKPATPANPPPSPVEPPKKPAVGSMDAIATIAGIDVSGSLPSSAVQRGVERVLPALRDCYRAAAKAQQATPAVTVSLTFEVDESSAARNVSVKGGKFGTLASCAKAAIDRVQTRQAPDVGTVQVVLSVKFSPI